MKKDNKGEDMAEFKFVKRENELETITKSLGMRTKSWTV